MFEPILMCFVHRFRFQTINTTDYLIRIPGGCEMQINGPFSIHGAQPIQPQADVAPVEEVKVTETSLQPTDELVLSSESTMVSRVHQTPDIRMDRVAEIRAQIADGTYETAEKLELAVGRMLDEFA